MGLLSDEERGYLVREFQEKLREEVILHLFLRDGEEEESSHFARQVVEELQGLNRLITVQYHSFPEDQEATALFGIDKTPAIVPARKGRNYRVRFYGAPGGYEFNSLVEDMIDISRGEVDLPRDVIQEVREIEHDLHIQVFVTPACPYCPGAVRTAHKFALVNERITADMVMATEFHELANRYGVTAVPYTVVNERISFVGTLPEREFLSRILGELRP